MKRKFLALLVALVSVLVLPVGVALADSGTPSFTAQATLVQDPTAGSVSYLCLAGGPLPYPCEFLGGMTIGVAQVGELFNGTFAACDGQQCSQILGSSIGATQGSVIFFTGAGPNPGDVNFAGTVSGTFVITKKAGKSVHTLNGSYSGGVTGTINLVTHAITGLQVSGWRAIGASGGFDSLKRVSGTISAPIGGFFPGYETATATVTGAHHDKD